MAALADMFDAYGSPPLKPFQPIQRRPAPTASMATLLGASISRSLCSLGPITAAATKPATPAERWITYPPEKSTAPCWAKNPPPQIRNASTQYTQVIHRAQKGSQALKFTRPRTEPSARIGVIAANTSWKYTSADFGNAWLPSSGMLLWPWSSECESTGPG